jgi:hypothetical protein
MAPQLPRPHGRACFALLYSDFVEKNIKIIRKTRHFCYLEIKIAIQRDS